MDMTLEPDATVSPDGRDDTLNKRRLPLASRSDLIALAERDYDPALVRINDAAILSNPWPEERLHPTTISLTGAVANCPNSALAFLLLVTSINFRFWRLEHGVLQRYRHRGMTGDRALWAAFERAWGPGESTPDGLRRNLSEHGIQGLFGEIPDPNARAFILDEMLSDDLLDFCRALVTRILTSSVLRVEDADSLAARFPKAYGDPYLKKAQLALSLFAGYLRAEAIAIDTSDLTSFADYQVTRVLEILGILQYGSSLGRKVLRQRPIKLGSSDERAIRAATILAGERIARHVGATPADVGHILLQSQELAWSMPFYLTETTWY